MILTNRFKKGAKRRVGTTYVHVPGITWTSMTSGSNSSKHFDIEIVDSHDLTRQRNLRMSREEMQALVDLMQAALAVK